MTATVCSYVTIPSFIFPNYFFPNPRSKWNDKKSENGSIVHRVISVADWLMPPKWHVVGKSHCTPTQNGFYIKSGVRQIGGHERPVGATIPLGISMGLIELITLLKCSILYRYGVYYIYKLLPQISSTPQLLCIVWNKYSLINI